MVSVQVVTDSGVYELKVFSSLYIDYGLEINKITRVEGTKGWTSKLVFHNPCCLSVESYGFKYDEDKYDCYEEAEDKEDLVYWETEDWEEMLQTEADDFLEAFLMPYD